MVLASPAALAAIIMLCGSILYVSIAAIWRKKSIRNSIIMALAAILAFVTFKSAANAAFWATHPASSTIIAGILYDKQIITIGPIRMPYFIVKINDDTLGVITNPNTYGNARAVPGSSFDYTLYTYMKGDSIIMYRFLKPEFKVKVEPGNLQ